MTPRIVQRLRHAVAAIRDARVSMRARAPAHGPEDALLMLATTCLLPVPVIGTVLGMGRVALAVAMWQCRCAPCLPQRSAEPELPRQWAQRGLGIVMAKGGRGTEAGRWVTAFDAGPSRAPPRPTRSQRRCRCQSSWASIVVDRSRKLRSGRTARKPAPRLVRDRLTSRVTARAFVAATRSLRVNSSEGLLMIESE